MMPYRQFHRRVPDKGALARGREPKAPGRSRKSVHDDPGSDGPSAAGQTLAQRVEGIESASVTACRAVPRAA